MVSDRHPLRFKLEKKCNQLSAFLFRLFILIVDDRPSARIMQELGLAGTTGSVRS